MEKLQILDVYELLMVILKDGYMYGIYCMLNMCTFLKSYYAAITYSISFKYSLKCFHLFYHMLYPLTVVY